MPASSGEKNLFASSRSSWRRKPVGRAIKKTLLVIPPKLSTATPSCFLTLYSFSTRPLLLKRRIKTDNAPKTEPAKAPKDLNPKSTKVIPHTALTKSSTAAAYDNVPNASMEVYNPLNIPVRLQTKSVNPRGKNNSKLPVLRNTWIRGDNKISPKPTTDASVIPSFVENFLIFSKFIPATLPVTATLVIAPLKIFTGIDTAIIKAYKTLNSA